MSAERIAREAGVIREEAIEQSAKELEHSIEVLGQLRAEIDQLKGGEDTFRAIHELLKARRTVEAFLLLEQRRKGSAVRYRAEVDGFRRQLVTAGGGTCLIASMNFVAVLGVLGSVLHRTTHR